MSQEPLVAFEVCKGTPELRFLASLSDGTTVIQDERPNQLHAWHRLSDFLKTKPDLKITCLRLQRGTVTVTMPTGQVGYFYGKKLVKIFPGGEEKHGIGIGFFDGVVVTIRWLNPDTLATVEVENRDPGVAGFCLIRPQ